MSRIIAVASLVAAAGLGFVPNGAAAQGASANAGPTVTIANVPLPVTGEVNIAGTSTPLPVVGSVSIVGTPTVEIWPQRIPYHFRLDSTTPTHAIPEGTILEMRHVSCHANTANETNATLGIRLLVGEHPNQVILLALHIPQAGLNNRSYAATQTTAAYLGAVPNRNFGRVIELEEYLGVGAPSFFTDCYVAGELTIL